jgi:hypothetical protein
MLLISSFILLYWQITDWNWLEEKFGCSACGLSQSWVWEILLNLPLRITPAHLMIPSDQITGILVETALFAFKSNILFTTDLNKSHLHYNLAPHCKRFEPRNLIVSCLKLTLALQIPMALSLDTNNSLDEKAIVLKVMVTNRKHLTSSHVCHYKQTTVISCMYEHCSL